MKEYQNILLDQLNTRKRRNPQFSLRAFAKNLEMSPSQLSSLINGKKNLTLKQAAKIIEKLNLDEQTSSDFLKEMLPNSKRLPDFADEPRILSEDEFSLISNWEHFAILGLSYLKENSADSKWIGKKLGIDPFIALEAFERLQRMGLINVERGKFRQTSKPLTTTSDIPSEAIKNSHRRTLKLADEKLESVATHQREYNSITMAANPAKIARAKKMIWDFSNKLCKELEDGEVSQVYTLAIQLFPLTQQESP